MKKKVLYEKKNMSERIIYKKKNYFNIYIILKISNQFFIIEIYSIIFKLSFLMQRKSILSQENVDYKEFMN